MLCMGLVCGEITPEYHSLKLIRAELIRLYCVQMKIPETFLYKFVSLRDCVYFQRELLIFTLPAVQSLVFVYLPIPKMLSKTVLSPLPVHAPVAYDLLRAKSRLRSICGETHNRLL